MSKITILITVICDLWLLWPRFLCLSYLPKRLTFQPDTVDYHCWLSWRYSWKSCRINLVISNISINFVHNLRQNPLKMQYMTNISIMRVGGGIFESYLPHSECINSLCRTTSHYIVWEGDNPSCLSIAVTTLSHRVACLAAGDSWFRASLSDESRVAGCDLSWGHQRRALHQDSPEHLRRLSRDWHWAWCMGRRRADRIHFWQPVTPPTYGKDTTINSYWRCDGTRGRVHRYRRRNQESP